MIVPTPPPGKVRPHVGRSPLSCGRQVCYVLLILIGNGPLAMCGIAGIVAPSGHPCTEDRLRRLLPAMRDTMEHRGPDGEGVWLSEDARVGLVHRRLSIVDLNPGAEQPMANEDGRLRLVFNGEIYNHALLRKELVERGHRFASDHSYTEVIVHGYEEWGIDGLLERLEGMFAFALWDEDNRRLTLARDRIGIKPAYFSKIDGSFRFASEIKAILADPGFPRRVDPMAVNHFLSFLVTPPPLTMFEGIYKLPAGWLLEVDGDLRVRARRYWDPTPGKGIGHGELDGLSGAALEDFFVTGIRKRLEAAVEKRMMADVPFGVLLSGGIDSSANVAMMSRIMDRPVETFTVGFKDFTHLNELDQARRAAETFGTNHHEVRIDADDMVSYIEDLMHHQDEPIADWVCIPLHFVSRLARDAGVKVVLVGEGSDEQFCGYDSYLTYLDLERRFWGPYTRMVPGALRRLGAWGAEQLTSGAPRLDKVSEILHRAGRGHELFWSGANAFWNVHKQRLLEAPFPAAAWPDLSEAGFETSGIEPADSGRVVDAFFDDFDRNHPGADYLTRMAYTELRLRLPELLLMRVDKITMANSVEGRVPFLDHHLVEFTMDIPQAWKLRGGEPKYLLKKALGDLLPDWVLNQKKRGFGAPMADWLRGDFGRRAESTVLGSALLSDFPFDKGHVAGMFREHRDGRRDRSLHIWALFNLCAWHDQWIAGRA